ncbi:MAG: gliding motility-associated C-terminal domain-containing protein [Chitinophagaceae bacterium]|nr:gliding motility-associated C-terminal domain-containing protein [Chitinophagaceae bacterium]
MIDPLTNDMYTIYASQILSPILDNHVFKNPAPYSASTLAWNVPSGFTTLVEVKNRPYLAAGNNDNSINGLSVNSSYLYYWDGLNLKAFNKTNGSQAGNVLTFSSNTKLMQGGIVADECNNIFIGNTNGTIKTYHFDGTSFDDAAVADITIPGFPLAPVYDLAYDPARMLLYACGKGFVASFDISSYCPNTIFNLSVALDCPTLSAQAIISPAPPPGTVLTYALFVGTTQVATNSTGLFTGLSLSTNYSVKAYLDQACSGIQLVENFSTSTCLPILSATFINPSCNLPNGSIHAVAVSGIPPYQFSKDGINFQASGIFTGLAAGNYTITVKDAANNIATVNVTLVNSLPLQVTAVTVPSSCIQFDGKITATGTGGSPALNYSLDGINFQPSGIFTGLAPGNFTITVKDTNNCRATVTVFVDSLNTVIVNAGNNFSICEGTQKTMAGTSNGTTVLWTPSTGLSNPSILTPVANPVISTLYTLTASIGFCKAMSTVTVLVNPAPVANAGRDTGICFGNNFQLNGSGGTAYIWRPSTYLSSTSIANPVMVQPAPGSITYRLTVTDANGCISLTDDDITISISRQAKLFVGYDTAIAINQPLQLFGVDVFNAGFINYTWSPTYGLNDPFSKNPVAILDRDMIYNVTASNAYGCTATDDIKIKVYKGPEIYVPNSFTPNGDGLNDVLRPIVIGMKEFHYFTVYNNYGQMVFTSAVAANGWDGTFKGSKQPVGGYVWMAEAVDYKGNKIQRKGSAVLIR